ncbi:MAG: 4Fe-4S binding protein [Desulfobacterales bacterium]|nr:4Fe-4S binding protein [Desulfobacterales bacterium]
MGKGKQVKHLIDKEWCKGCGICIHFCPKNVLEFDKQGKAKAARPEDCIACKLCELRCPDLAIQIIEEQEVEHEKQE